MRSHKMQNKIQKDHMPENIRTADHTWMILNQMPNFQRFFRGYLEILKSNLKQVSVMGERWQGTIPLLYLRAGP